MKNNEVAFKQQFSSLMPILLGSTIFLVFMSLNIYHGYVDLNTYSQIVMLGAGALVLLTSGLRLVVPVVIVKDEGLLLKHLFRKNDFVSWADVTEFKIVKRKAANSRKEAKNPEFCVLISTIYSKTWHPVNEGFAGFKSEGHTVQVGKTESDHLELLDTLKNYHQAFKKNVRK